MKKKQIQVAINFLTLLRIIGIPFLFVLSPVGQIILLIALFLTDFFDGFLARKFAVTSELGAILDLLADKILVLFLLGMYYYLDKLNIWIVILLGARELYSIWIRVKHYRRENKLIGASIIGKTKTFLQFVAFTLLILGVDSWIYNSVFIVVIILSYYSIAGYVFESLKRDDKNDK